MRLPVTPDFYLAPHPEIDGQLAMAADCEEIGGTTAREIYEGDPSKSGLARSIQGQIGNHFVFLEEGKTHNGPTLERATRLFLPFVIKSHTERGAQMAADMYTIADQTPRGQFARHNGEPIPAGRFFDLSQVVQLDANDVERYRADGLIYFAPSATNHDEPVYRFTSSGETQVKLSRDEYVLEPEDFSTTDSRLNLLLQGRSGIKREVGMVEHDPEDLIPEFLLGGLAVSGGPFYWRIKERVNDHLIQLSSAALIDANRNTGTGLHLDSYERNRQVELVKQVDPESKQPTPTFGNTWVPIEFFSLRPSRGRKRHQLGTEWRMLDRNELLDRHINGVTPLKALRLANPSVRTPLLSEVERSDTDAMAVGRVAVQRIKKSRSNQGKVKRIVRALEHRGEGIPEDARDPEAWRQAMDTLSDVGDMSATIIAEELHPHEVKTIIDAGARAILVKRLLGKSAARGVMDAAHHTILNDYARKGIGIAMGDENNYRELHSSGYWILDGVASRMKNIAVPMSIYGGNRQQFYDVYARELELLLKNLVGVTGPQDEVAVFQGGGDGIMYAAHRAAIEANALSFTSGIDKEGAVAKLIMEEGHGHVFREVMAVLSRQHPLVAHTLFSLILPGGIGTGLEYDAEALLRKLFVNPPTPFYVLNINGHYDGMRQQYDKYANDSVRGSVYSPREYMPKLIRYVEDLEEMFDDMVEFMRDPASRWEEDGIPPNHVDRSCSNKGKILQDDGMAIPLWLQRGRDDYLAHA